ncbi:MAG TPA: MBL fold metallo-hydrolase [Vicinamibacterales bacterium]|nr:MBL fold metallo-hydrolase [Vicinamibacterales bacterium]
MSKDAKDRAASRHHRRRASVIAAAGIAAGLCGTPRMQAARNTLDIYFIDVEGGQSTLVATPAGETLLVDTGFPGSGGTFDAVPGDPAKARDAQRILAAARDAGAAQIDYLLTTHFHADHDGGVVELAQLLPIRTFVDHGRVLPDAEETSRGTLAAFDRYAAVRARGRHLEPAPGDRIPLKGVEAIVVSGAGATLKMPLSGAGGRTVGCADTASPAQEPHENPRSSGVRLQFGRFRFLDLGDLTGPPLFALACPENLIGPVDVYLVAHHGGLDAADPATFAAFRPRVSIVNNGPVKGGAPAIFKTLHASQNAGDVYQLHKSQNAGAENFADEHIANLDTSTAHWIKVSASADGAFTVTNARTGTARRYPPR